MVTRIGTWHGLKEIKKDFTDLSRSQSSKIKSELMQLISKSCLEVARQYSPVDSGDYADGWYVITLTDRLVEIGNKNDGMVDILDKGTHAHKIQAKPGHKLRFWWKGNLVYTSSVNHPGTSAQPHLEKILKIMNDMIMGLIETVMANNSPLFKEAKTITMRRTSNIAGIGGLAGFGRNVGRGRIHIVRPRTGQKQFRRRLGLRRRTGHFISGAEIKIG